MCNFQGISLLQASHSGIIQFFGLFLTVKNTEGTDLFRKTGLERLAGFVVGWRGGTVGSALASQHKLFRFKSKNTWMETIA